MPEEKPQGDAADPKGDAPDPAPGNFSKGLSRVQQQVSELTKTVGKIVGVVEALQQKPPASVEPDPDDAGTFVTTRHLKPLLDSVQKLTGALPGLQQEISRIGSKVETTGFWRDFRDQNPGIDGKKILESVESAVDDEYGSDVDEGSRQIVVRDRFNAEVRRAKAAAEAGKKPGKGARSDTAGVAVAGEGAKAGAGGGDEPPSKAELRRMRADHLRAIIAGPKGSPGS